MAQFVFPVDLIVLFGILVGQLERDKNRFRKKVCWAIYLPKGHFSSMFPRSQYQSIPIYSK